jgi:putative ABC transport system permease protein
MSGTLSLALQLQPILTALRRHKAAVLLIVLQVALTLTVVSNALLVLHTRFAHLSRPTGADEANLFVIRNGWLGNPGTERIDAQMRADLATLRGLPGVRDAFASEAFPLQGGGGLLAGLKHELGQTTRPAFAIAYFADEHALGTLGVRLVAGRNFRADEIARAGPYDPVALTVIIITRDLATKLFPDGTALGRTVYIDGPGVIVGIVERLQGAYAGSSVRSIDEDSILLPARLADPGGTVYLVRARPGQLQAAVQAAVPALMKQSRMRLIDAEEGVLTLAQARELGYAIDRGVAITMAVISVMLLLATTAGIVGLSSFWVSQRRRQIGIRRALGATRGDILAYFQIENFLIVGVGVGLGIALAVAGNLWLMARGELPRMPPLFALLGALVLWLLGQIAVLGSARRAAAISPVAAIQVG